jgi:HSP20 family molecular chaperone IbpA
MHPSIIPALRHPSPAPAATVRQPHFETAHAAEGLRLDVFVPGVEPSGVEITTVGPDLVVRARRAHPVRVNWTALQLETAQRDYELQLRLGRGLDFDGLRAEMRDGILRILVPKRHSGDTRVQAREVA